MNQSYSRDLTNRRKKNKTGWISMVWKLLTLNCCVHLLSRHLSSLFSMPDCFWLWHFWIGNGGTKERAKRNQHRLPGLLYGNHLLLGLDFLGFGLFCFGLFSCPMKFMNQWHALSSHLFCIISLV